VRARIRHIRQSALLGVRAWSRTLRRHVVTALGRSSESARVVPGRANKDQGLRSGGSLHRWPCCPASAGARGEAGRPARRARGGRASARDGRPAGGGTRVREN
jgi:hypothetical protein